jgi:hypothetical protein
VQSQLLNCRDSIHPGHHEIHEHYVRLKLSNTCQRLSSAAGFTDDGDILGAHQEKAQANANDRMIVDQ